MELSKITKLQTILNKKKSIKKEIKIGSFKRGGPRRFKQSERHVGE